MGKSLPNSDSSLENNNSISAYITLNGSVPIMVGDKEIVSLTGSATIVKIGGKRYLVDLGMFQGGEGADFFNQQNTDFLKDIDGVIVTHSHIDHIGRLPILYKMGYRGPIYMTYVCAKITHKMLLDSCKIQEGEVEERMRRNNKLGLRLKKALKIKQYLLNGNFSKNTTEKNKQKLFLESVLGKDYNKNNILNSIDQYLDFYEVSREEDIQGVLSKMKSQDYDENDIEGVMGLIKSLENGEERILNSRQIRASHNNHELQEILDNFPLKIVQGYNEKITVSSRSEKRKLRQKWEKQLSANIRESIQQGTSYDQQKQELQRNLETAYTFCKSYSYLEDESLSQNTREHKSILRSYNEYKKLLKKYYITEYYQIENRVNGIQGKLDLYEQFLDTGVVRNRKKIEQVISEIEVFVDEFDIRLPFRSVDIKAAYDQLEIDSTTGKDREVTGITFSDAAHIIGAVSVTFTSGVVRNKVNKLMDLNGDATTVYLSGDLGRIDHNRLGRPDIPPMPVDYLQIESTYGGKEHRDREESVQDLVDSIKQSKGNVLISVFSQQRTQEILQTLLEYKSQNSIDALDFEILIDAPLARDVTEIYMRYQGEVYNLLDPKAQEEIFGGQVIRFLEQDEWKDIYSEVDGTIEDKKFLGQLTNWANQHNSKDISELINKIQIHMFGEQLFIENDDEWVPREGIQTSQKYLFLTEHIDLEDTKNSIFSDRLLNLLQRELFGKKIFLATENDSYRVIDDTKKKIILASSGMIDGGAIMNHLNGILTDKDATLLAPGYLSIGTIGNDIVIQKEPIITVNGEQIPVNCTTKFVDGFSSHIGHADILQFITESIKSGKLKQNSTIALNHGSRRGQELLKKDLEEILIGLDRQDISITIPDIFDTYDVLERDFSKDMNSDLITNYVPKDACMVPEFLLSNNLQQDDTEEEKKEEEIPQYHYEVQHKNSTTIDAIGNKINKIISQINSVGENYFLEFVSHLDASGSQAMKRFDTIYGKLQSISGFQKSYLNTTIDDIFQQQRLDKSELSRCKAEIKSLENFSEDRELMEEIYEKMSDFFMNQKSKIENELSHLEENITQLEQQKEDIEKQYHIKQDDKDIDTFKGSKEYVQYHKSLKKILDKIQTYKIQIRGKTKTLSDTSKGIRRSCYNVDSLVMKQHILQDLRNYEAGEYGNVKGLNHILELCNSIIEDIKNKIKQIESNLNIYQDIEFTRRSLHFNGIDMYSEVFGDENNIDLQKLQNYIDQGFFSPDDLEYIITHFDEVRTKSKESEKSFNKLRKFFKAKQSDNNDLGVNYHLDVQEYNDVCLKVLEHLFEDEYFQSYIKPHFNVYLLLKTGSSTKTNNHIKQYIINKYDLTQLKGFTEYFKAFEPILDEVEYFSRILDKILLTNKDSLENLEDLENTHFGIYVTQTEVAQIESRFTSTLGKQ